VVFDRRLPLRLGEHNDRGRLDIQPGATRVDLTEQDRGTLVAGELVDRLLAVGG
jgi:hypothetical protein